MLKRERQSLSERGLMAILWLALIVTVFGELFKVWRDKL
jgi:hypothetical protein